jgi:hypothetical protein
MAKVDDVIETIRRLAGRAPSGVPINVSDDVARAAAANLDPQAVQLTGAEVWSDPARGMSPGLAAALRDAPAGDPAAEAVKVYVRGKPDFSGVEASSAWHDPEWRHVAREVESDGFPDIYRENWPVHSGVSGKQVQLSPAAQRQLNSARGTGPADFSGIDIGPLDSAPDFELGSPLWHQLDKGWRANDNLRRGRTPNLRNQDPQLARVAGDAIRTKNADAASARAADAERADSIRGGLGELGAAAATVGVGAGLASLYPSGEKPAQGDLTDTSGNADLVEESRPAPKVDSELPPDEQEFADRFKRQYLAREAKRNAPADYSFQARELMDQLNTMRRAAGGEVPEAKAMMAEINRLLELSNKQRNAPDYEPPMPTDYRGEAQRLLQKLNARRMEVGGEVPETDQVMAEVRRLQALGDRQRNVR